MLVTIKRYDPDGDRAWTQEYEVDTTHRSMTVMDVLEYIETKLDHTLAYYKHSICNHGICARCTLSVNGKVKLACTELANDYDALELAPAPNRPVVRDLVTGVPSSVL